LLQQTATVLAFSAALGIEIDIPGASIRKEPFESKLQQTVTVLAFLAALGMEKSIPDASIRKEPFGSKLTIELDTSLVSPARNSIATFKLILDSVQYLEGRVRENHLTRCT